jgi:hypothetical protein
LSRCRNPAEMEKSLDRRLAVRRGLPMRIWFWTARYTIVA